MPVSYEKTKDGFRVNVPKDLEEAFQAEFKSAKRVGDHWTVGPRTENRLKEWAAENVGDADQPTAIGSDDLHAIESELERVGPDMVRRRILNRQKENIIANRAAEKLRARGQLA